jgi:hypothetical protein
VISVPVERDGMVVAELVDDDTGSMRLRSRVRGLTAAESRDAVARVVARDPGGDVVLVTGDAQLRHAARTAGFGGPLRAALRRGASSPVAGRELLAALLPGVHLGSWRKRGTLLRLSSGVGDVVSFRAARGDSALHVRTPWRETTLVESLAAAIDTALRLIERFPVLGRTRLAFEVSDTRMVEHRVAGYAQSAAVTVHAAYVDAAMLDRILLADPRARLRDPDAPLGWWIDEVVAHELGHQLDFEAGTLSGRTEFRTRIGVELGVGSVEQALRGTETAAPPSWRAARDALVASVSDYATTNTYELFAELFVASMRHRVPVTEAFVGLVTDRFPAASPAAAELWPGRVFGAG